jgi:hypothetical protein
VAGLLLGLAIAGVLIGLYITVWAVGNTPPFRAQPVAAQQHTVQLTLQTVPTVGPPGQAHQTWVSYLVQKPNGKWERSTVYTVPANSIVKVTIYNFDTASGLRNPFLGKPEGLVNGEMVDGKPLTVMPPDQPSHTFAIPELGVLVPIAPVGDNAKNQCGAAPCTLAMAHRTITFSFRTGKKGHYRWQCFVPCAAGFEYGFGGPMQTIGYMDGFINVV